MPSFQTRRPGSPVCPAVNLYPLPTLIAILGTVSRLLANEGNDDLSNLSLDQLLETKVATVTAASRRDQAVEQAPSSVTIVTSDDIRKLGYQTLADVLTGVRGFYTTSDRNYSYLGIRGFGRQGDYNSRVLVLVDGHRVNDNVTGGVTLGDGFIVDVDLIDRVEIVRGPGSSLYGNNAFFGVVNVVTRKGKDLSGVETSVSAGSFGSYRGRLSIGYELDHGIDFLASGTLLNRDGHDRLFYQEYVNPPVSDGFTRNTDGENSRSAFGQLSWNGIRFEGGWVERTKNIPTGSFATVFGDPRNSTVDGNYFVDLSLNHSFENEVVLDARVSYDTYQYRGLYVYPLSTLDSPSGTTDSIEHISGRWWTEDVHAHRSWNDQWTLTAGFEMRQNIAQNQNNIQTVPYRQTLHENHHSTVWAPYLDGSWEVLTNLTMSAGIRYDQGEFVGNSLSPRASLVFNPITPTTFKLLYGKSFRGPNAYERFYSDGGLTQKGNPGLEAETDETYELVVEQKLGTHFRASLSGYYYIAHDLINQTVDPTDGLQVYKNISSVRGRGIEAEVTGHFEGGLRGRLSYCLQRAVAEDTHNELNNSPTHLIQGNIIFPIYQEVLFGGAELRYVSARENEPAGHANAYWVANLTLYSHRIWRRVDISASIYNLFDHKYLDPTPIELRQTVLEQDGRTFLVKLTAGF